MIVTIHQPYYLPYLGLFHKILKSDIFVFLDNAQYEKGNFYNRNKINSNSSEILLTVPINLENHKTNIDAIKISSSKWQIKHYKSIVQSYNKAPFFNDHIVFLDKCYLETKWDKLVDLNMFMFNYFLEYLEIDIPIYKASSMNINTLQTERLKDICKIVKADIYLSGPSGKKYLEENIFQNANVKIIYQKFAHSEYNTIHKKFLPYMSILDILMNEGKNSKNIILNMDQN